MLSLLFLRKCEEKHMTVKILVSPGHGLPTSDGSEHTADVRQTLILPCSSSGKSRLIESCALSSTALCILPRALAARQKSLGERREREIILRVRASWGGGGGGGAQSDPGHFQYSGWNVGVLFRTTHGMCVMGAMSWTVLQDLGWLVWYYSMDWLDIFATKRSSTQSKRYIM